MQTNLLNRLTMRNFLKTAGLLVILVVVFGLGLGLGNGDLVAAFDAGSLNRQLPNQLNYSSVNMVYQALKNNYDGKLTVKQLLNGLKHGLANAANDPYTEYFTPQEASAFNNELNMRLAASERN